MCNKITINIEFRTILMDPTSPNKYLFQSKCWKFPCYDWVRCKKRFDEVSLKIYKTLY